MTTIAQVLDTEEYLIWDNQKFYDSVQTVVIKIADNTYRIVDVPKCLVQELLLEKKTREQKTISEYNEDLKNWELYSDIMWNLLIYGN